MSGPDHFAGAVWTATTTIEKITSNLPEDRQVDFLRSLATRMAWRAEALNRNRNPDPED